MPTLPIPTLVSHLSEQVGRLGHIATTILRAGVVPFPDVTRGLAELAPLVRYGTTLGGLYEIAAASAGDRTALVDDDRAVSYAELRDHVASLAHELAARFDLDEGSAVGLLARNHIGFVETVLACQRLGVDVILLNSGMSAAQAATIADEQHLALLVADPDLLDLLAEAAADIPRLVCGAADPSVADRVAGATSDLLDSPLRRTAAPREDGRTVVMTSGTTGAPKGARRPSSAGPDAAASILSRIPFRAQEVHHIAPPLFHTWGFANLQIAVMLRATVVLRRTFDPVDLLRTLSVHRCSTLAVVPVMLQRVLEVEEDDRPPVDLSALRIVASSGSALPAGLPARWQQAHGLTLYNLYGSTEVSWATIATPEELRDRPGTAGRAPRGTRLAVLGEDGQPVPTGEVGRIFVGNDLHFEGYTGGVAGKQVVEGMMATGDVGRVDADGLLFVAGRDDDMIVSGGENVYPKEVEDLLSDHDDVVEAAVIGVEDTDFGHRLAAFVVRRLESLDEAAVKAHVKANLARFSVPRDVVFLDELPRNPTGKVVAKELRQHLA